MRQTDIFLLNSCKQELLSANSGNAENANKQKGECWDLKWQLQWFSFGRTWSRGKDKDISRQHRHLSRQFLSSEWVTPSQWRPITLPITAFSLHHLYSSRAQANSKPFLIKLTGVLGTEEWAESAAMLNTSCADLIHLATWDLSFCWESWSYNSHDLDMRAK